MTIYSQINSNKAKSILIIFLFIVFVTTIAYVFGKALGYGVGGVGIGLIIAAVMSYVSYFFSDEIVLATSGARQIQKNDNPELFRIVENLCIADGLSMPKVYIMQDASPNAFATGRDPKHAVVCATTGILEKLNSVELEGVIAHELSHVKNYDIRVMSIVVILVGAVALLSNIFMQSLWFRDDERENNNGIFLVVGLVLAVLSPLIATLMQLAISRKRELLADASGALLTRYPEGLASALEKISDDPVPLRTANNATAHLYIVNPFKGKTAAGFLVGLFNTHPATTERIKILRSM